MGNDRSYFSDWQSLEEAIKKCNRCPLHRSRKNAVPGEGDKNAHIMLVGEAPGATEDEMGRPFVGAAGRLLTMILESLGVKRESVYITNVVKCRPPGNREPKDEEVEACSPYLESQILLLKPRVIVTLGNVAGKKIFALGNHPWNGVMKMRGKIFNLNMLSLSMLVIPTLHPAAALYNPQLRSLFEEDMKLIKKVVESMSKEVPGKSQRAKSRTLLDYLKQPRNSM
jgi:uracil-DNA glycosylase, family 4|uniref:Type-4 uracil-DNA glycosylase n=1 Tax=Ignisphaera aggregans TaxID=334771 RepID=A0A7J2T9G3_9CREN